MTARFSLIALSVLALAACATATPYQPAAPSGAGRAYGFTETRLDGDDWRVGFSGNSLTSRETVERYLLYRAAELTVQQGFDWFETSDRNTERRSTYSTSGDPFYRAGFGATYGWGWRPRWRYYGRRGWVMARAWPGDPFWGPDAAVHEWTRYEAAAGISMGRGPAPQGRRVLVAREVIENLRPGIVMPQAQGR